ncbi:hypothetical protein [Genomoviridae sp.]|nr:hypothetical protein [Genomoviridae sp.]
MAAIMAAMAVAGGVTDGVSGGVLQRRHWRRGVEFGGRGHFWRTFLGRGWVGLCLARAKKSDFLELCV